MVTSKKSVEAAIAIRDRILERVKREGQFERTNIGPVLIWNGADGFKAIHRTPFNKLPPRKTPDSSEGKYLYALIEQQRGGSINLPSGLDLYAPGVSGKVMNIEWDDSSGQLHLVSFRRGDWEAKVFFQTKACATKKGEDP